MPDIILEADTPDTVVDAVADTAVAVAQAVATVVEVIETRETVEDLTDAAEMTRLREENERLKGELSYQQGLRDAEASNAEVLEAAIVTAAIVAETVAEETVEEITMETETTTDLPTNTDSSVVTEVEDKTPTVDVETQEDYDKKADKRRRKLPYGKARN